MLDMKSLHFILGCFALFTVLVVARPVTACPACQDAIINSSGKDDDDPMREARAYNRSIYLMVAVPYGTLSMLGLLVYRGYRTALKKALAERQLGISAGV
jgi:membrane protease YdiL (CAAX protease family)